MFDDLLVAELDADVVEFDEAFGLAVGGGKVDGCGCGLGSRRDLFELTDELVRVVDARLGFRSAGFGSAAEPLDLGADSVAERLFEARLRLLVGFAGLEELRVGALDAE